MAGAEIDSELYAAIFEFIEQYADGMHYAKEEEAWFPALRAVGLPHMGPIACLLMEHDGSRELFDQMRGALTAIQAGDASRRPQLFQSSDHFAALVRQHAHKEDQGLVQMTQMMLGPGQMEELGRSFEAIQARYPRSIGDVANEVRARFETPADDGRFSRPRFEAPNDLHHGPDADRLQRALAAIDGPGPSR
jgi:hemerythrin-like domain-containing protein